MVGVTASGVINLADAIASGLHVNRHYVDETGRYDPRLLVFEFVRNVVLRKGQVDVVQGFSKALRDENLKLRLLLNRLLGSEAAEVNGDAGGAAAGSDGHPNGQAQEATT